jgi:diguanylate cyclase (GGDEF)-like protein
VTARTFDIKALRVLAAAAAAAVVVLIVSLPLLAMGIDARERQRELAVVSAGVAQLSHDLLQRMGVVSNWDQILLNLDNRFDAGWAQQNLVSPFEGDVTNRLIMVLDQHDDVVFSREHARPVAAARTNAARAAMTGLMAQIRSKEDARRASLMRPGPRTAADWVVGSTVVVIQGRAYLVGASVVGADLGVVRRQHARAPVLVTASDLQTSILPVLVTQLLLRDAVVSTGTLPARQVGLKLTDTAGNTTAWLGWMAEQPGQTMVHGALPALAIVVGALFAAVLVAYRQGTQVARVLRDSETRAQHRAMHDGLTGLANRSLLDDRIGQALSRARRQGSEVAVMLMDLDGFKAVNDTFGHQCGDELIQEIGRRLLRFCRAADTCARLGGDEFVILVEDSGAVEMASFAARLLAAIEEPATLAPVLDRHQHQPRRRDRCRRSDAAGRPRAVQGQG